jgi:hypothetical protein
MNVSRGFCLSPVSLSLDTPFFLFPISFGLTARAIPLRSGLRVFCFVAHIRTTMNTYRKAMEKSKREAHGKVVRLVLASQVA